MTQTPSFFSALKDNFQTISKLDPSDDAHLLAALVLAGDEEDLSSLEGHLDNLERLLRTRVMADVDGDSLDQDFSNGNFEALEDLIRVGLDWSHPNFSEAPDELVSWMSLDDERQYTLRGEDFSEDLPFNVACPIDPLNFAKQIWHGDGTMDWLEDRLHVADAICRFNTSSWIIALAILAEENENEAFQLAAEAAIFSAAASANAENSNEFYYNLASGNPDYDETFDLIYAAIEDLDEQEVLIQSASVEILRQRNADHPAIDGAPFSGTSYDDEELVAAKAILNRIDESPSEKMQSARLMSDILVADFDEKKALLQTLSDKNKTLAFLLGDEEALFKKACGDDLLGLAAIEVLLEKNNPKRLLSLLESCSLYRVDYIRNRLAFVLS